MLWDMDGTLVNTEPLWMAAETELVESFGAAWTHDRALELVGNGLIGSARILQSAGVRMGEQEIIRWLTDHVKAHLDPRSMPWRPGARELLVALREAGVATALVTMSYRDMALEIAGQLGFTGFDAVIAGDDVAHEKPHPEPYLRGAEAIGLPIGDCVALEDSVIGLGSAVAAGAATVAIPFILEIPDSPDYVKWDSLVGRGVDDVVAVLESRSPVR